MAALFLAIVHIIGRNERVRRAVAYAAKRERFLKPGTSGMPIIFKQWQSAGNI